MDRVNVVTQSGKRMSPQRITLALRPIENEICGRYQRGESGVMLAKAYGITHRTVYQILRRNSITPRNMSAAKQHYQFNELAFDGGPQSLYWAGFLMADGCVQYRKNKSVSAEITLHLAGKDGAHVHAFRDFMGSTHPINEYHYRGRHIVRFTFYSNIVANSLADYGVVPRKTFTASAPEWVRDSRDFWRGMVDGDGHIGLSDRSGRRKSARVYLVGTLTLVEQFVEFLRSNNIVHNAQIRPHGKIFRISIHGKAARQIMALLYVPSIIALPRKLATAQRILALDTESREWNRA